MRTRRPGGALRQLRALFQAGTATGLTDGELLEQYTARRAESAEAAAAAEMAFAALMNRHGAMVWGVCCRVLGNCHEAEDAFQATFLVLVRKAGSVRVDGSLGRWLYAVAHRVALRARSQGEQRRSEIGRMPPQSPNDPAGEVELRDLRTIIGEELDGLPAKYRCPVELCHLQGLTYDEAARQLNWPVATVKNRLTKGRLRLRARLTQRGLAPSAVAAGVATAFAGEARAAVPRGLVQSTARAATAPASGFPAAVTELTSGVLKMMMWEKLRLVAVGVLVAAGLSAQALSKPPSGGSRAARTSQTAARPAGEAEEKEVTDRRWTRTLPSGATVEVIGVSSVPSGPDTWWRPDGTPLHRAPRDPTEQEAKADDVTQKVFVVRVSRIPREADHEWSIAEARGAAQGPTKRDGKRVPGLFETIATLPADARNCTVRFKVAAGPWITIRSTGKYTGCGRTKDEASYIFGDATATATGMSLSVTHNIQNQFVRLVAVDVADSEHPGVTQSTMDVTVFRQVKFDFDQHLEQIKEFRLESRPYEQVEIPNIAIHRK
jgi:RNA polymerase sigma factor (sigma-70 family)